MKPRFSGTVSTLPPDKSISHRAALIASLSVGESIIENFSDGLDNQTTLSVLKELGIAIREIHRASPTTPATISITSKGLWSFAAPTRYLQCNNSGSTMRMLSGILAAQPFCSTLVGDASLMKRPMRRVAEPLSQMGATISLSAKDTAPVLICGTTALRPQRFRLPVASAQVKSALIFAALHTQGTTEIIEPLPTRNHTEVMLGLLTPQDPVMQTEGSAPIIRVTGPVTLPSRSFRIPADPSGAAFLVALGLLSGSAYLKIEGVCVNPTRTGFLRALDPYCQIMREAPRDAGGEATNDLILNDAFLSAPLRLTDPSLVANVIDEIPILAVLSSFACQAFYVEKAGELRAKECDRIDALVTNLRRCGFRCEEFEDGFEVLGRDRVPDQETVINTFHDHRIAMAFAIAAAATAEPLVLSETESIPVSFPNFFSLLESLRQ